MDTPRHPGAANEWISTAVKVAAVGAMLGLVLGLAVVFRQPVYQGPDGATAACRDGSYSYSAHYTGTCSSHGGVRAWRCATIIDRVLHATPNWSNSDPDADVAEGC